MADSLHRRYTLIAWHSLLSFTRRGLGYLTGTRAYSSLTRARAVTILKDQISFEPGQWKAETIRISLSTINNAEVNFSGEVLTSSRPSQSNNIEFQLKIGTIRRTDIDIPLWVSSDASIKLSVNGHSVDNFELAGSKQLPTIHRLSCDLTRWGWSNVTVRPQLTIFYKGSKATATIPLDCERSEWEARLVQKWSWSNAILSMSFFTLAWGSILGLLIIVAAHLQPLSDKLRLYAVLALVVIWVASILGIPDLIKILTRPALRKVYSLARARPAFWYPALSILFVLTSFGAGTAVYCLGIRQYYSTLIVRALESQGERQDGYIVRAFALLPWRKEAQILFEQRAYQLRNPQDMSAFRKFVQAFASQPDVQQALDRASTTSNCSWCLEKETDIAFSDPTVWYASILPEAEDESTNILMAEAVRILSLKKNTETKILRLGFQLYLYMASSDDSKATETASDIRDLLMEPEITKNFSHTYAYQVGCDFLASYYVGFCQPNEASVWFERELGARSQRQKVTGELLWHRPPQKLILYHMLRSYGGGAEPNREMANQLLDYNGEHSECQPFRQLFYEKFVKNYPDYKEEPAWLSQTALDTQLGTYVRETLLNKGWKP